MIEERLTTDALLDEALEALSCRPGREERQAAYHAYFHSIALSLMAVAQELERLNDQIERERMARSSP